MYKTEDSRVGNINSKEVLKDQTTFKSNLGKIKKKIQNQKQKI